MTNNSMLPFVIKDEVVNQTMHIEPLFPTPIGITQVDKVLNKKILEFIKIKQLKFIKNTGGGGNSISSDRYILENDELSDIKKVLTDSVNQYFKEMVNNDKDTKLYITNSWINVSKNGDSHHAHKHTNSIVSAILYIDTCEGDTVSFIKEHTDVFGNFKFTVGHSEIKSTLYTQNGRHMPVKNNLLTMFPSTLPHVVMPRPNTCTGTRISLSFNTWFKGTIGDSDSLTLLHL
jgi:uncharacterized protein (TIGR02466 family)